MGLFYRLLKTFEKNKAHQELLEDYVLLNEITSNLYQLLSRLRKLHEELVALRISSQKSQRTGGLGLDKTLFIKEELLPKLKKLSSKTEQRFLTFTSNLEKKEPVSIIEKDEIHKVIEFLEKIQLLLHRLEGLEEKKPYEQILSLEEVLKEVVSLCHDRLSKDQLIQDLIRRVQEEEISPLLRDIYENSQFHPLSPTSLIYYLKKRDLRRLEKETSRINACADPNFQVEWRKWWKGRQSPEVDQTTPIKSPHINITIKLFGGPKKKIHLIPKGEY